jgi:hypothetical protein
MYQTPALPFMPRSSSGSSENKKGDEAMYQTPEGWSEDTEREETTDQISKFWNKEDWILEAMHHISELPRPR